MSPMTAILMSLAAALFRPTSAIGLGRRPQLIYWDSRRIQLPASTECKVMYKRMHFLLLCVLIFFQAVLHLHLPLSIPIFPHEVLHTDSVFERFTPLEALY